MRLPKLAGWSGATPISGNFSQPFRDALLWDRPVYWVRDGSPHGGGQQNGTPIFKCWWLEDSLWHWVNPKEVLWLQRWIQLVRGGETTWKARCPTFFWQLRHLTDMPGWRMENTTFAQISAKFIILNAIAVFVFWFLKVAWKTATLPKNCLKT